MAAPHRKPSGASVASCTVGREAATIWLESSDPSRSLPSSEVLSLRRNSSRAWFSYDFVSVDVKVKEAKELLGFQWNLNFDPSQLEVLQVTEGNFLFGDGGTTYWRAPYIDSLNGRIIGTAAARLTKQGISGEGVLATILFRVNSNDFELFKNLRLTNVKLANAAGSLEVFTSFTDDFVLRLVDEPLFASSQENFVRKLKLQQVISVPNPMKQKCYFTYVLTYEAPVTIKIYTVSGRLIRTLSEDSDASYNEVFWDGCDETGSKVANGIYLYKVIADDGQSKVQEIKKLAVLR